MSGSSKMLEPRGVDENEIKKLVSNIINEKLVADIDFINVTPWWGGGGWTETIKCLDDNCRSKVISMPTAKTIMGKARWILMTAFNKYVEADKYDVLIKIVSRLLGSTSGASNYNIVVEIEETNKAKTYAEYNDIKNLLRIIIRIISRFARIRNIGRKEANKIISILEVLAFYFIRQHYGISNNTLLSSIPSGLSYVNFYALARRLSNNIVDYVKLFAIPRFRLYSQRLASEASNERLTLDKASRYLYEYQPLRPGSIRIRVKILKRANTNIVEDSLVILSIVSALMLLGIGKAANRGFGRFVPVKVNHIIELKELKELLSSLVDDKDLNKYIDSIRSLLSLLLKYAKEYIERVGEEFKTQSCSKRIPVLPKASDTILLANVYHPCMVPGVVLTKVNSSNAQSLNCVNNRIKVNTPEEVLSAIGYATLKSIWKIHANISCQNLKISIKSPGTSMHTWILGLPREAQNKGYLFLKIREEFDVYCTKNLERKDIRRQSAIILSPLFSSDLRCRGVLVMPFISIEDHILVLDGVWIEDEIAQYALYHVGCHHFKQQCPNRRPYLVIGVKSIISNRGTISAQGNCGEGLGGVVKLEPNNKCSTNAYSDQNQAVKEIISLTVNNIVKLLS